MKRGLLVALLFAAFGVAWWLARTPQAEPETPDRAATADEAATNARSAAPDVGVREVSHAPEREPQAATDRVEAGATWLTTIRDPRGEPVPGATVTLTPLPTLDPASHWSLLDWKQLDASTSRASSGSDGAVGLTLAADADPSTPWALHVTAPGFAIESRALANLGKWAEHRVVTLKPGDARLRVVAATEEPPGPVRVELFGNVAYRTRSSDSGLEIAARRVLHRTFEFADPLWLPICSSEDEVALVVDGDALVAASREGKLVGDVTLTVHAAFYVRGAVELGAGETFEERATVLISTDDPYATERIAELPVRTDGTFGPAACAWTGVTRYAFNLLSSRCLPQRLALDVPKPGETLVVSFPHEPATPVRMRVVDESDRPLAGVAVGLSWPSDAPPRSVYPAAALTDDAGVASLPAPGSGPIDARAKKRGWAPVYSGPYLFETGTERELELRMKRGGRIHGRVTRAGRQVPSFEVVYWPPTDVDQTALLGVDGNRDGRFEIADVELRPLLLYASAKDQPRSEIVSVEFKNGEAGPIELELPDAGRGRGRVVDSDSREPIAGASVQVWNAWNLQIMTPIGEPATSVSDGTFEVAGLRPGRNVLWVQAPGYHWAQPSIVAEPGVVADTGMIAVDREAGLAVALESADPTDFGRYQLSTSGAVVMPYAPFDPSGRASIPSIARGRCRILIAYPDGSVVNFLHSVRGPVPSELRHTVASGAEVETRVRMEPDCASDGPLELAIEYHDGRRWIARWATLSEEGSARFRGVPSGTWSVVLHSGGVALTRQRIAIGNDEVQSIDLDVDCSQKVLRIVDDDGTPRANCEIWARCANSDLAGYAWFAVTDSSGRASLAWPDCRELVLGAVGFRSRLGVQVTIDDAEEQLVRLPAPAELRLRLHDQDVALEGISVWVEEPSLELPLPVQLTDRSGVVVWNDVAPAAYALSIEGQGLWRTQATRSAKPTPAEVQSIDVRRVGALELDVRGALGEPIEGARIVLTSLEFAATTEDWLADGKLGACQPTSDASGRARFTALPHGEYRWTATLDDGRRANGLAMVKPASTETALVLVP
ncbi:MAG: carboxypeptidase regulatory-like domain-containing protein [Planctomycetes bacterium]|nr:carboxypeptidase regulatory-like domain-containing protein [Planctomycetota bacterium]